MFSIRIVTADHYVSHPISGLDALQSSQIKVPVIRIFGATPAGQKTCMHVHGVFPYIYVPYDGTQPWNTYLQQFAASLDKAINIAAGNSNSNAKHVYKINLVSGISMYGYHSKEESFLKIYFYNPYIIKKVADLLLGGAVFNKVFQPHEAHIPYLLQMFIDYNLYGMNLLSVSHAKFRRCKSDDNINLKVQRDNESSRTSNLENSSGNITISSQSWFDNDIHNRKWDLSTIQEDLLLANSVHRQSTCELEVDVVAADILNRQTVDSNMGANPGLVALWEDEKQRRRNRQETSQLQATPSQERRNVTKASSEAELRYRLKTIIQFNQFHSQDTSKTTDSSVSPSSPLPPPPYLPHASLVECHSFNSDAAESHEKTFVFGDQDSEEEGEDQSISAVVNVDCVQQVVESSQSFKEDSSQSASGSDAATKLLASLLASQGSNLSSQELLTTNEEHDSILLSQPASSPADDDVDEQEMSQVFSDDLNSEPNEQLESDDLNLSEFGQSWDGSMVSDDEDRDFDVDPMGTHMPQFDGPIDEKPSDEQPKIRKRLGTRGPVTTAGNNPSAHPENQPSNYPPYGSMYQNEPSYMPPNTGMQAYHQSPSNYPDYDRRWDSHPFREDMSGGVDQQASHWNHGWSRSMHSSRGDPSGYPGGGGSVHGNNGSYMTEGFSRPYPNHHQQQPPPPPPPPPQSQPQQQVAPMTDSSGEQYSNPYPYDMSNMYSPETYSRSRTSVEGGHTPDARQSPFAGHLSPSPGYSRDGFETSRSPVPLSGNVSSMQGSAGAMYNQTPPIPHPDESQGSFHKLLTSSDSPKQTPPSADISTHQSLQRSISRCSTHSSESMSMGASTTPDPFKNMAKPVASEETSLETFEKLPTIEKVDETAEGRSSVDSSNHPPSETGNASLTPLDSNSGSQKKRVSSLNMSHEDLFGSPSLNSCADLSSDSFTSAEGSRHPSNVDPTNTAGYMATGYSKNSTHTQRCSSVTSEEEAPSYQSLTMPFTGNRSGNRVHSAIASLEQMVSSVGGYDMSGYDYPAYPNRSWQCTSPQGPHNMTTLHTMQPAPGPNMPPGPGPNMPPGPGPNMPPGSNMPQGPPTMPPAGSLPSGSSIPSGPNMPPNQTITQSPNIPSNPNMNPSQNMNSGPPIPPGSNMPVGANMSSRSNLHTLQGRGHTGGHSIPPMSSGHSLTPHNIPTHNMQSGPNMNMSQSQHMTQGRGMAQGMSHNMHSGLHNLTSHAHTMQPQGHNVHPSHNMASNPSLAPPPSHSMATAPTTAQGHSMSSSHNMMQSHNLPQAHPMTPGHDRPHSYNMSEQGYQQHPPQPEAVSHKQGRLALKKKRPDTENWSYAGNSYYQQQGRTWNHPTGPPGQNYGNPSYWNYMDSYPNPAPAYQGYPQNPKVDQPEFFTMQKPHKIPTPGIPGQKSKRGRKRSSFTMAKSPTVIPPDPQASCYTYTFHVPTPIYKRLKFLQKSSNTEENAVCIVRMHPMDARRYSLLKIGRELVKVPKLEPSDIEKIQNEIKEKGDYLGDSILGPSEQRGHLISKGSHLPPTSESTVDDESKQLSLGKKMLPLAPKAPSKSAPSGFQLEYERMLLQNHPRVTEKSLKSEMSMPYMGRGCDRPPRRMRIRGAGRRKRQSPVKMKDYADPFSTETGMEGSMLSGLLSSDDEKFSPSGSQLQTLHPSPTTMGVRPQFPNTSDMQPDHPLSSKRGGNTSMRTRGNPRMRRSTRPFPKQRIVSSLMASPHTNTAGPGFYGNEGYGRGQPLPHRQQHHMGPHMRNSGPNPSSYAPMTSSYVNNNNQFSPQTNQQSNPVTCKVDKDEITSRPDSPDSERKPPVNSCKDQRGFQSSISSPSNSPPPPPPSGPSAWQSNNMSGGMGSGVSQFTNLSANHNTQQQQRKRKFCPDNGNTYKDAPTNFNGMNFNGIYNNHSDGDDDDDYVVDDDDEDDDDDDNRSNYVCNLVVKKRTARQKSLVVKLEKLNLPNKSVKASEFLASHKTGRRRVCTGNRISRRMENVGWERIELSSKNKQRRGGLPLMSYSGSMGGGNGHLELFTHHTEDLFCERPSIDNFQDDYLGVSITGTIDEAGETGLLMSLEDEGYSRAANTDSSSGEDATVSTEEEFEVKSRGKNKRKRNLTPNQRLGVAFLTTRHRRKKALPLNHGKLMNSLSLLHQATMAKLTDTSTTYTGTSDDFKMSYNDVMSKLAMFSPPVSEKGDTSPPQPLSPEENGLGTIEGNPDEDGDGNFALDSNDTRSMLTCQTSMDSLYETPLSSVETQRSCESAKSPGLTSLGGSETEHLPPVEQIPLATKQEETTESKTPLNSKKGEPLLEKSPYAIKTAVVKLIPRTRSGAKSKTDRKTENGKEAEGRSNMDPVCGQKTDGYGDIVLDMEHSVQNSVWLNSNSFKPSQAQGPKPGSTQSRDQANFPNASFGQSQRNSAQTEPASFQLDVSDRPNEYVHEASASMEEELNCDSQVVFSQPLGNLPEGNKKDDCSQKKESVSAASSNNTVAKHNPKMDERAKVAMTKPNWITTVHDEESRSGFADIESSGRSGQFFSSLGDNQGLEAPGPQQDMANTSTPKLGSAKNGDKPKNESRENDGHLSNQNEQNQLEGTISCPSGKAADKSVVLRPLDNPPSKDSICHSAASYGLSISQVTDPFCGRPEDITDTPRELGGRILRLQSLLLKDLTAFNSILDGETLYNWRIILACNQGILQVENDINKLNKLFIDPQLHCNLVGNRQRVMTPCVPPPTRHQVASFENLTLHAPADTTQTKEEQDSFLINPDDSMQTSPDKPCREPDENDTLQILLSLPRSPSPFPPFSPECKVRPLAVENQESRTQELCEQPRSPLLKGLEIDRIQPDKQQMHSTPLRSRRFSIPAPVFTPIAMQKKGPKINVEKDDPQPSTSKAQPEKTNHLRRQLASKRMRQWTPVEKAITSQIEGPTPRNTYGFKVSQLDLQEAKSTVTVQHICTMSLEMHMESRGKKNPDPELDPIQAMFVAISEDYAPSDHHLFIIVVDPVALRKSVASPLSNVNSQVKGLLHQTISPKDVKITYVYDECELISELETLVKRWDPDILVGYEMCMMSWGYLLQRAAKLNIELVSRISRIPGSKPPSYSSEDVDINLPGRIVLNLWRIMKHEVNLNIYTVENVVYHVLHQRIPRYTYQSLSNWFNHKTHLYRWRVVEYFLFRAKANLMLIDQLDLIGKTSEFARVFGIEFYHVLSRGSQYRVESMMLRIAKPLNFIAVSPSVKQRAKMRAPECIPLNLEPESRFYSHPVIVLDFQSLYPSIMIAYNYCFSTCLGRLENLTAAHEGPIEFGCTHLNVPSALLKDLEDDVTISPNGVVFVKEHIQKGIISRMVEDILNTRIMVKKSMKKCKDKALHKMLHARQLGLKLIANVTYGYTAANFSGRMPCIEVGDSIVRKARETLEKAIHLIEMTPEWNAKVIYGDTDSVFVLLKGRSKEDAIRLGQHMADVVTASNPKPVKLKFEKVYLPCVLQTKKRYVGFMYETEDQKEPVFDAKGIETVRRDGCAAASKILERTIKILFTSRDVSRVKDYVVQQCHKIIDGKVNLQEFIFAKEYRGLNSYRPAACVPALEIAKKLIRSDRRAEPQSGERVPYVIVYGEPGLPLIQLVRQPWELLNDPTLRLNAAYYITKQILPPLNRIFSLMGVNVFKWYTDMPKTIRYATNRNTDTKTRISHYFNTMACLVCGNQSQESICLKCEAQPQMMAVTISNQLHNIQQIHHHLSQICHSCTGARDATVSCISLDCPILHRAHRAQQDINKLPTLQEILNSI